jgi:hypothetical protein
LISQHQHQSTARKLFNRLTKKQVEEVGGRISIDSCRYRVKQLPMSQFFYTSLMVGAFYISPLDGTKIGLMELCERLRVKSMERGVRGLELSRGESHGKKSVLHNFYGKELVPIINVSFIKVCIKQFCV